MNRHVYKIFLFPLFLLIAICTGAQSKTTVKASVDRNQILIGEPIQLRLEVEIPENETLRFFNIDSIAHFEFLQQSKIDTANTSSGTLLVRIIPITSFDSGRWVIPSFSLADNLATDTIPVDVGFSSFDPNQDYHDIKDIIEVTPATKRQWWWYIAGGGLLLLLLLIYLFRKKKPQGITTPQPFTNAYEEAMEQIAKLQREGSDPKQYYSELTGIFRLYVFRKRGILSLQKTMNDLVVQLKSLNIDKEQFDKLSQTLRLSDFVKFAKYIPTPEDDRNSLEIIRNSIMTIEKSESVLPPLEGVRGRSD